MWPPFAVSAVSSPERAAIAEASEKLALQAGLPRGLQLGETLVAEPKALLSVELAEFRAERLELPILVGPGLGKLGLRGLMRVHGTSSAALCRTAPGRTHLSRVAYYLQLTCGPPPSSLHEQPLPSAFCTQPQLEALPHSGSQLHAAPPLPLSSQYQPAGQ
jgi:hypothetical protein